MRSKSLSILYLTFLVGSIVGLSIGFYQIYTNRFLEFSMIRYAAQTLLKFWNHWAIIFLSGTIILLFMVYAWKLGWRLVFSGAVEVKDEKRVVSFFIFLVLFLSIGWFANKFWLPYRFHPKSIIADLAILLFSLLIAWIFLKGKWIVITRILGKIWKIAVPLAFLLILLNGILILDKRANAPQTPNVVWILIDALRADHLGSYGYRRETSPFIDELARKGILFKNAYSQESYTIPSVPSFFSSTYPTFHRVLYNSPALDLLDSKFFTLAEILREKNYKTAAFFFNPHLQGSWDIAQGFEVYEGVGGDDVDDPHIPMYIRHETASLIYKKTENYLVKSGWDHRPLFLYLHLLDVHSPYAPPPPYDKLFLPSDLHAYSEILEDRPFCLKPELNWCIDLYDGGIRYTDSYIKKIVEMLAKHGLNYENTIFILTADHGEEFFDEHPHDGGGYLHGRTLYQEQIHVPLIMSIPEKKAVHKTVNTNVQSIDIAPTILDVIGIDWEKYRQFQGRSLLSLIEGKRPRFNIVFSGGNHGRGVVIYGDWKLYEYEIGCKENRPDCFKRPSAKSEKIMGQELYNIKLDPRETNNLIKSEPEITKRLQRALSAFLISSKTNPRSIQLDDETLDELKALGYLD